MRNLFTSYIAGSLTGMVTGGFGIPGGPLIATYYMSSYMSSNFVTKIQRANVIITVGVGMSFLVGV